VTLNETPDLVVVNWEKDKIIVVNVTIPFEGEADSLTVARQNKEENLAI